MKAIVKLYKNRKEQILSMFSRTMIQQKPKIQNMKKIYKREKYKGDIE